MSESERERVETDEVLRADTFGRNAFWISLIAAAQLTYVWIAGVLPLDEGPFLLRMALHFVGTLGPWLAWLAVLGSIGILNDRRWGERLLAIPVFALIAYDLLFCLGAFQDLWLESGLLALPMMLGIGFTALFLGFFFWTIATGLWEIGAIPVRAKSRERGRDGARTPAPCLAFEQVEEVEGD